MYFPQIENLELKAFKFGFKKTMAVLWTGCLAVSAFQRSKEGQKVHCWPIIITKANIFSKFLELLEFLLLIKTLSNHRFIAWNIFKLFVSIQWNPKETLVFSQGKFRGKSTCFCYRESFKSSDLRHRKNIYFFVIFAQYLIWQ